MAHPSIVAALFAVLLALTEATTNLPTIDEENPDQSPQKCSEQVQMEQIRHCVLYLDPYESLPLVVTNPEYEYNVKCCAELQKIDETCRCAAVKMALKQHEKRKWNAQEVEGMMRKAKKLPQSCDKHYSQECQI